MTATDSTIFVLVSEDGSQVLTDLDNGKIMAWPSWFDADLMLRGVGDDYGRLHVESRELSE